MAKHPAAFINAIAEEGTKAEAIKYLQETWDERCEYKRMAEQHMREIANLVEKNEKLENELEEMRYLYQP